MDQPNDNFLESQPNPSVVERDALQLLAILREAFPDVSA